MEATDRKFRTMHLKAGERVVLRVPYRYRDTIDLKDKYWGTIEIESLGKSRDRGNRHTVRVEAPPGSSIEIVKESTP